MLVRRVVIKKCSMFDFWYQHEMQKEFDVVNLDSEFYKLKDSNKVIYKEDCEVLSVLKVKEPKKNTIEYQLKSDGFKNASEALSKLGVFEFKKRYRKRVLS